MLWLHPHADTTCLISQMVLLGDAAHPMSPMLGQALDCGLEDVAVFAEVLAKHEGDVDVALPAFTKRRRPQLTALLNVDELATGLYHPVMGSDQVFRLSQKHARSCSTIQCVRLLGMHFDMSGQCMQHLGTDVRSSMSLALPACTRSHRSRNTGQT